MPVEHLDKSCVQLVWPRVTPVDDPSFCRRVFSAKELAGLKKKKKMKNNNDDDTKIVKSRMS